MIIKTKKQFKKRIKIKTKPDSDSENEYRRKSINNKQINNKSLLSKKEKQSFTKENKRFAIPKNNNNINEFDYYDKK